MKVKKVIKHREGRSLKPEVPYDEIEVALKVG